MDAKDIHNIQEAYMKVVENQQLDELSVNKMLAYGKAAEKDRDALNKKWDKKKASRKEKWRVLSHEAGEERAAEKIKKKTGKYPHQMNALDKARYAVTKEELDTCDSLDEAEKWIQKAIEKPGALSKQLGVPEGENIPAEKLAAAAKKGGKLGKRARLAMTLKGLRREEVDLYDIIFTHLLDEGYADTEEAASAIMVNMSEEWRESIVIAEGMDMKTFKQQRSRQKQKEKRAADKIAPNRRKDIHTDKYSPERAARHRANVDPDFEGDDERNYPGGRLRKNKEAKARALGELG